MKTPDKTALSSALWHLSARFVGAVRMRSITTLLAVLCATVSAQPVAGTIGVTGFSTTQFSTIDPAGIVTQHGIGNFGGTGLASSQAILWDPNGPADFFVGGYGFVGRASFASATPTYTLLTNNVSEVAQMSIGPGGVVIVADGTTGQITSVDPATGVVTPLTSGPQPWGTDLNAGAFDLATGDMFVGGNGTIHVIPSGSTTPTLFANAPGFVSGITFDPSNGDVVASFVSSQRVVRFDRATAAATQLVTPGSIQSPNSIAVDLAGDFIVGAFGGDVWRVPNAGGTATYLGTASGQGITASGVTVMGTGTASPGFTLSVTPSGSGGATVSLSGIPQGTTEGWTLLSLDTSAPLGAGPVLGATPDATTLGLIQAFPVATAGGPVHWTWPASAGVWPAAPYTVPGGVLPIGTTIDVLALALNGPTSIIGATPIVRTSF